MRRFSRSLVPLIALAALAGCLSSTAPDVNPGSDPSQEIFAASLGVDLAQMTKIDMPDYQRAVWYSDIATTDTGTVAAITDTITFHYTLWLKDGRKIDSSIDRGVSATLPLRDLIGGWQIGVPGMKAGGTRRLVIPSIFGYGPGGSRDGSVPPNATLIFEVQLLKVAKPK